MKNQNDQYYLKKYLKYKNKYIQKKKMLGGYIGGELDPKSEGIDTDETDYTLHTEKDNIKKIQNTETDISEIMGKLSNEGGFTDKFIEENIDIIKDYIDKPISDIISIFKCIELESQDEIYQLEYN